MPYVEGKFVPKPFIPLTGNLLDVIPPDDPEAGEGPPTKADWAWWRGVRAAAAEFLMFVVEEVRKNYDGYHGFAFRPAVVAQMMKKAQDISDEFFDGEYTATFISKQLNKMAKQVGLVVYSTEPGPRENWPMAAGELDEDKVLEMIEEAMRGRWSTLTEEAHLHDR